MVLGKTYHRTFRALELQQQICEKFGYKGITDEEKDLVLECMREREMEIKAKQVEAEYRQLSDMIDEEKYEEVICPLIEVVEQIKEYIGEKTPIYIGALTNLGDVQEKLGQYPEAIDTYRNLSEAMKTHGFKHWSMVEYALKPLALLLTAQGNHDEAIRCLNESLSIFKDSPPDNQALMDEINALLKNITTKVSQ